MKNPEQVSELKRRLLDRVLRGEMARTIWEAPVQPRTLGTKVPLAPSQQQVWLHSQMGDTRFVYNEPITIHYRAPLDEGAFRRSFHEFLRRHEIWRTTFASVDGQVVQVVHPHLDIEIPLCDLTTLPSEAREAEAMRIATADARRPFDLAVGPLLRGRLFKLCGDRYRFHLTLHHIIFDGVSICRTVLPELAAIYRAFAQGEPSPLPEPALQYGDFALWQNRIQNSPSVSEQVTYWRDQLAGELPVLQLPTDHARPPMPSYRGSMETFSLSPGLTESLKRRSKAEGVTPYMFLLAAFKTLLHRYSGQEDILVGGVIDGRRRLEFHNLLGFFLQTVVLRTRPIAQTPFREYLGEVKDAVLAALANGDVPFDRLVRELQPKRDSSRHPFFQVLFSIQPPATPVEMPWEVTQMDIATGASKVDLYLEIDEEKDRMIARFIYNTDVFETPTIQRMVRHWLTLLEAAVEAPDTLLRDLPILTPEERLWLRDTGAGARCELPQSTIHDLIEAQARRTPSAVAIECKGEWVSYRELNDRATLLAHRLREAGAGPQTLVGLCVERSSNMVVALLAILKAGGAYVPIDPALPSQRIALMMEDAKAPFVLTETALAAQLSGTGAQVVCVDDPSKVDEDAPAGSVLPVARPEDLAYVIFTSGSTGKPKGAEVSHRAVVNLLLAMQQEPGFAATDKLLAVTTLCFDIAGLELYLPLISGGTVVIASKEDARDPARLADRMRESGSSVMQATPATWRSLIESGWPGDPKLRILCGGEALPRDLAQQLLFRCGELWNMYGPTETTIWSTIQRITSPASVIPIGRPIANTDVFVLDPNLNPLPIGVMGELYIGGAGVARGYLHRADLTRERFISSPFHPPARLYRTGDLARWLPEGTLECLGRADNQVKIRGFRVETEEIESAIAELPGVTGVAVKAWRDESGAMALSAYICGAPGTDPRRALQHKLPEYMIPQRFMLIDALPLTPNGKVDRNALAKPGAVRAATPYVAPSNGIERRLEHIFKSVLDVPRVSVRENFFDLGGHSLLVMKLIRRIELEFGKRLTMSAVFQSRTIEDLALLLGDPNRIEEGPHAVDIQSTRAREPLLSSHGGHFVSLPPSRPNATHPLVSVTLDRSEEQRSLIRMRPGANRAPFYCIPGMGGSILSLRRLAMAVPADLPFYCLQEKALDGSEPFHTIEETAAFYVNEIRKLQPQGPYYIGGGCYGGLVAFEMAQQLVGLGQEVGLLAMIDTYNQAYGSTLPFPKWVSCNIRYIVQRTAHHIRRLRKESGAGRISYLAGRVTSLRRYTKGFVAILAGRAKTQGLSEVDSESVVEDDCHVALHRVVAANLEAQRQYVPEPYLGPILLFRATERVPEPFQDKLLGWSFAARGPVEVCDVAGDHDDLGTDTSARVIAAALDSALRAAEPASADALTVGISNGFMVKSFAAPAAYHGEAGS